MHTNSSDGGGDHMKIKVYRTIRQVLGRLTSMREYAFITTEREIKDPGLIRLISSDRTPVKEYIYVGRTVFSRERFDQNECLAEIRKKFPFLRNDEIRFPQITQLYRLSEDKVLVTDVPGDDLQDVNQRWICDCLRFRMNEREKYLNDDFTSVKLSLSRIEGRMAEQRMAEKRSVEERSAGQKGEKPVFVDVGDYEVYDRMIRDLNRIGKEQLYGDAYSIEYSIVSDDHEHRYYLTHFFSNHNWNLDPQNLLNICFTAEVLSGSADRDSVRFHHPSKVTTQSSDGAEYLVEAIRMDNRDVSVKFVNSDTKEPSKGDAAGPRNYDNPVDFAMWVDVYYQEIRMA